MQKWYYDKKLPAQKKSRALDFLASVASKFLLTEVLRKRVFIVLVKVSTGLGEFLSVSEPLFLKFCFFSPPCIAYPVDRDLKD